MGTMVPFKRKLNKGAMVISRRGISPVWANLLSFSWRERTILGCRTLADEWSRSLCLVTKPDADVVAFKAFFNSPSIRCEVRGQGSEA